MFIVKFSEIIGLGVKCVIVEVLKVGKFMIFFVYVVVDEGVYMGFESMSLVVV